MPQYIIQGETLTNIANAIRSKTGSSATMTPDEMVSAIGAIETGSNVEYTNAEGEKF